MGASAAGAERFYCVECPMDCTGVLRMSCVLR